jgi:hypothetical protein
MLDVFVRKATRAAREGVVAEAVRWSPASDPSAPRHQVVTLYGEPVLAHLAWAVAAASRSQVDERLWSITADGSASANELELAAATLREDAEVLLARNGSQLRSAIAHLQVTRGPLGGSPGIRVPLDFDVATGSNQSDSLLDRLREAEGGVEMDAASNDELAA